MVSAWFVYGIIQGCIPILGFLISAYYMFRSKKIFFFVAFALAVGMLAAITGLSLGIHWTDKCFEISWNGTFDIFLLISSEGILYWLVAFEFYTSAVTMDQILLNKPQSFDKKKKYIIFFIVSGLYILLQIVLCLVQWNIKKE